MYKEKIYLKNPNRPAKIGKGNTTKKGVVSEEHFHPELEFLYIKEGKMSCKMRDETIILKKGDILFINSNVPHSTEILQERSISNLVQFKNPTIQTSLKYLPVITKNNDIKYYLFDEKNDDYEELKDVFKKIVIYNRTSDISNDFYITSCIFKITAILHKNKLLPILEGNIDIEVLNRIYPVFEYIDKNYSNIIQIEELADKLKVTREYFCRLFKKATGLTATEYINYVRVCKAEKLLMTDMNLSEISYAVGITSLSYFNVVFKKYKNCSPSEYRNNSKYMETLFDYKG